MGDDSSPFLQSVPFDSFRLLMNPSFCSVNSNNNDNSNIIKLKI